jgi:hypothetical protein
VPELLPGGLSSGFVTVLTIVLLRARAGRPRPAFWKLALI